MPVGAYGGSAGLEKSGPTQCNAMQWNAIKASFVSSHEHTHASQPTH